MKCESCGMEMKVPEQFANHDTDSSLCVYCTDGDGNLLPKNNVREAIIQYWLQKDQIDRLTAEERIDEFMAHQPAWKENA
jgi:hypothetical protein